MSRHHRGTHRRLRRGRNVTPGELDGWSFPRRGHPRLARPRVGLCTRPAVRRRQL